MNPPLSQRSQERENHRRCWRWYPFIKEKCTVRRCKRRPDEATRRFELPRGNVRSISQYIIRLRWRKYSGDHRRDAPGKPKGQKIVRHVGGFRQFCKAIVVWEREFQPINRPFSLSLSLFLLLLDRFLHRFIRRTSRIRTFNYNLYRITGVRYRNLSNARSINSATIRANNLARAR